MIITDLIAFLEEITDKIHEDGTLSSETEDGTLRNHHSIEPELIDRAKVLLQRLKKVDNV